MRILGIDPGTAHIGWCVLEANGGAIRWIASGHITSIDRDKLHSLCWTHAPIELAAVERVRAKFVPPARAETLVAVSELAGQIAGWLGCFGIPVRLYSAYDWRHALTGKGAATDAEVKSRLTITGFPERTNAHVRDAAGLAWYAAKQYALNALVAE